MTHIRSSIACNLDADVLLASLPLFGSEKVQAIEWSFDTLYKHRNIPDWFVSLLHAFSAENRLIGHGVYFSLFSGKWSSDQQAWLDHLTQVCTNFNFDHITEHFGFMTGEDFHKGAPLSLPFNKTTLRIGQDRLKRIQAACQRPVGLENLAFSYSIEDVKKHGQFLHELLEPVNGFIILDLHNLFCQLHNFELNYEEVINLYPLKRVREIHISGGSWESTGANSTKKIRRDTHDSKVPENVFKLLETTINRCPNLKYVVLEQLGIGLSSDHQKKEFQDDFFRMESIVEKFNNTQPDRILENFLPNKLSLPASAPESLQLHEQQQILSALLEQSESVETLKKELQRSILAATDWRVENWAPEMLETAYNIAQKWKRGFE